MNIQQPIKPARGCKAWSGKDIAELLEMSAAGFTDQDIADAIGRSAKAVGLRRQRLVNQVTDAKVNKPTRRRGKIDKPTPAQIQESADRYFGIDPEPELSDDWVDTFVGNEYVESFKEEAETLTSPVQSSIATVNDDSYHLSIPKTAVRIALVAGAIAAGIQIGMYI